MPTGRRKAGKKDRPTLRRQTWEGWGKLSEKDLSRATRFLGTQRLTRELTKRYGPERVKSITEHLARKLKRAEPLGNADRSRRIKIKADLEKGRAAHGTFRQRYIPLKNGKFKVRKFDPKKGFFVSTKKTLTAREVRARDKARSRQRLGTTLSRLLDIPRKDSLALIRDLNRQATKNHNKFKRSKEYARLSPREKRKHTLKRERAKLRAALWQVVSDYGVHS